MLRMRNIVVNLLLIVFFILVVGLRIPVVAAEGNQPEYYTEIDNITEEEIAAIEKIKEEYPEGLIYGSLYCNEAFWNLHGEIEGFSVLMSEWLTAFFGIPFKTNIYSWENLMNGLQTGEIAVTGDLTAAPERQTGYYMTTPIAERVLKQFYVIQDESNYQLEDDEGKVYGFLEGAITYEQVASNTEEAFQAVFFTDYDKVIDALYAGDIDAFIDEETVEVSFEDYPEIVSKDYLPMLFTPVSLSAMNEDMSFIISVVQKYLEQEGLEFIYDLYQEGEYEYQRYIYKQQLTPKEQEYLEAYAKEGRVIRLAAEYDNYPISFYNKDAESWQGISHDILDEISKLTGLVFEVSNENNEDWDLLFQKMEDKEYDMLTSIILTRDRRDRFLWADDPFCTDTYSFLSSSSADDMTVSHVRNARVGLIEGTAYEEVFFRLFPQHENTRLYANSVQCFEALGRGEIDLMLASDNLLLSITHYMEWPDFKDNIPLTVSCDCYYAFNTEQEILCSIISKAQKVTKSDEIVNRWTRKVYNYDYRIEQQRIPYLMGICALLTAVIVLLIIIFRLREKKFKAIGMTDYLTQLPNRRAYDAQFHMAWKWSVRQSYEISLLTLDIDHFKQYNDTYGHPQGDALLKKFAEILQDALLRPSDMAMRTGGEEFAVILVNTNKEGAIRVAERIRERVQDASIKNSENGKITKFTVSIGIAVMTPGHSDSIEKLIYQSDQALYQAKNNGRNQVCCFDKNLV